MTFTGELFPYQVSAFERMVERRKVLLAYEQGTGKTVLTIAACEELMGSGEIDSPVLVIALSSLKYQWASEISTFSDSTALVIDGSRTQREGQYATVHDWENTGVDYVICNYEQVVNDWEYISQLPISAIIADEATMLKGFRSKRSRAVKRLSEKVDTKFALTGTPIENGKPEELYSLMQFVDPTVLGRFDHFDRAFIVRNYFGGVERYRNLPTLYTTMKDVMVRKRSTDEDVRDHMPTLRMQPPILINLDRSSQALYDRIASDLLASLEDAVELMGGNFNIDAHYGMAPSPNDPGGALKGQIMSQITALRMCCGNPMLLQTSADQFKESYETQRPKGSSYAYLLAEEGLLKSLPQIPVKAKRIVSHINDFLSTHPDNKVVVFTTFVGTVDLLCEHLPGSVSYTGRLNAKAKESARQQFKTDPNIRVLVSSDAGGYGVDLPEGNLLINYDLPWKSGTASQRNSRIIRASSEWGNVSVVNMLIRGSIEERMYEMLAQKSRVATAIVDGESIDSEGGVDITLASLRSFLS